MYAPSAAELIQTTFAGCLEVQGLAHGDKRPEQLEGLGQLIHQVEQLPL